MKPALILFCVTAATVAQPAASQNFSVSGVVVDSVKGRPLADYSVSTDVNVTWVGNTVVQTPATQQRTVTTDEQGRYKLDDLPPGAYRITARDPKNFGVSSVTRHIQLAGQDLDHVDFKVRVAGIISGRVVDENREPVVDVGVFLISREYYSGVLGYFFKDAGRTDDRGFYTIKRVEAGRPYIVMVDAGETKLPPRSPAPLDPALRRRAVVRTFYPNSPAKEGGTTITVGPGEKREGVDIEVRKAPSYCIEGTTSGLGGPAALMFNVEAAQPAYGQSSTGGMYGRTAGSTTGPDGKFRVCDLAPGQYRISAADSFRGPSINRALLPFEIVDRDLKSLNLAIGPGIAIQGEVVWDGPAPETPLDAKVSVSLDPLRRSPVANERPYARVDIPGTFTMEGLLPFEYAVRAFVNSPGVYVKDVAYGGRSVLHEPLRAGSAAGDLGLRVSLAHDGATLSATVADKDGNPMPDMRVIVLPANISSEAMLQAALVSGQTNQTGRYRSQTLRPGKYLALATDDRIDATPESIDNLWRSRNHFQEVELPPGGTAQVSLTPQPLRK